MRLLEVNDKRMYKEALDSVVLRWGLSRGTGLSRPLPTWACTCMTSDEFATRVEDRELLLDRVHFCFYVTGRYVWRLLGLCVYDVWYVCVCMASGMSTCVRCVSST